VTRPKKVTEIFAAYVKFPPKETGFTLFSSFGSKMLSTELGIIYNDQLWDAMNLWVNEFNLETDSLKPRKRPMSLASPSIITDGDGNVRMVIGAAGGKYIATALSQVNKCGILNGGAKI